MRALTFAVVLLPSLVSSLPAQETIVDDARGFRLRLPEGYLPNAKLTAAKPNIIHAFMTRDADDHGSHIVLIIEDLKKPIGPQHIRAEQMPADFKGRISTMKWRGFDVDVFEVPEEANGVPVLTFNVQIPLKQAAIQLQLFSAARRKPELQSQLQQIVDGLEGETNWIPGVSQVAAKMSSENYGYALLALAIAVIFGGLVALFILTRATPRGTVLVLAALIFAGSWSMEGAKAREVLTLTGSMRFLGFIGAILGIVDLLRKRPIPAVIAAGENPFQQR
jgi:hypothetical protein